MIKTLPTLRIYILKSFIPRIIGALVMFSVILGLVDLFSNLWRFLALDVPPMRIVLYIVLGVPSSLVNAVPVAILFATSYSLADLFASGELPIIFGSGISLVEFSLPLLIASIVIAGASFYFDDGVSVGATRARNTLQRELLHQTASFSSSDIAIISKGGKLVYHIGYFDDKANTISNVTIVERDDSGEPVAVIDAASATWKDSLWAMKTVRHFTRTADGSWTERHVANLELAEINESPGTFRSQNRDIKEMRRSEIAEYTRILENAGLPSNVARSELNRRYSFAFAPIIVTLMSIATGGRFRKNILLMSLLVSLVSATVYYVVQMMGMLLAKTGGLSPVTGAWLPLGLFAAISLGLFATART